jgi:hypothetical protein
MTLCRPLVDVNIFKLSATAIAGPTLKKSTRRNVGALPYSDVQFNAAEPILPAPPLAALVVPM